MEKMVNIGGLRVYSVLTIEGLKMAFADDIKRIEKEKRTVKNAAGKTYSYLVQKEYKNEEGTETSYYLLLSDAVKHYQAILKTGQSKIWFNEKTDYKTGEPIKSIVLMDMYESVLASHLFDKL